MPEREGAGRFLGGRAELRAHPSLSGHYGSAGSAARIMPLLRLPAPPFSREAGAEFPRDPVAGARREIQAGRAAVSAEGGTDGGQGERRRALTAPVPPRSSLAKSCG